MIFESGLILPLFPIVCIIVRMGERIAIFGLVGPSGVGKGYCKDAIKIAFGDRFKEPVVITTRPKRLTDGKDRQAGIPLNEFFNMRDSGVLLFAHQPFGLDTDWYGFSKESLETGDKTLLTEVHIDSVKPFRQRYGDRVFLIALTAERGYLERNIRERNTEAEDVIQTRLNVAWSEVEKIKQLKADGLIDRVIEVSDKNRRRLDTIITDLVSEVLD